jgi:hypothetical protein
MSVCFPIYASRAPHQYWPKKTKPAGSYNKTANSDPAATSASPVPATRLTAAAFVLEIGILGPVLVAATATELTTLSVLGTGILEVTIV